MGYITPKWLMVSSYKSVSMLMDIVKPHREGVGYITPKGLTVSSYKSVSMLMGYCQTPQGGGGVHYS